MWSRVSARARNESTICPINASRILTSCFWRRSRISFAPVPVINRKRFSRVDALLDAALDKPPEERASFLAEACDGDAALRDVVEKLLELSVEEDSLFPSGAMKGPIWEEVARELQGGDDASIVPGDHIGPYAVLGLLGRGGMGSVYRAKDPDLEREVAIKVLSRDFADDNSTLRRFEREAKLLASLNHPNIASIYDLLRVDDKRYLILELVEGPTLAERLTRGPLELFELLKFAEQIAEAVGEAHRKGVIHRDLKPSNIKITHEGRIKVLDFGLAKTHDEAAAEATTRTELVSAPTTRVGVVLGTPGYMSPEQARGESVDKRTDVWAFGCLLFEMLSGRRAFGGQTPSDAIAAVLRDQVDWGLLPADTPRALLRLMKRCLRQNARERLQDIGDARIEIAELARQGTAVDRAERGTKGRWVALASLAAFLAGMAFFRAIGDRGRFVTRGPLTRSTVVVGPEERLFVGASSTLALSPDASRLAFVAEKENHAMLYLRELGAYEMKAIRGSDEARDPFFSPDGAWIGFFAQGAMKKVAVSRGIAEIVTEAGLQSRGASWGENGTIVFAQDGAQGLLVVRAAGGEPAHISDLGGEPNVLEHLWPRWLPGESTVLFTVRSSSATGVVDQIALLDRESGTVTILGPGSQGSYLPSGHLVYVRGGSIEVAPFDPAGLRLTGSGVPLIEGIHAYPLGASTFATSSAGALVYMERTPSAVLDAIDSKGNVDVMPVSMGSPGWPRISPDGRLAAVHIGGRDSRELWIFDLTRPGSIRQLTIRGGGFPTWSPDGTRIAFMSRRGGTGDLYIVAADGSSPPEHLTGSGRTLIPVSWSTDGVLAYYEIGDVRQRDLWVIDVKNGSEPVPFVESPANELSPVFSPDGRYIAYVSNETGQNEIYVRPYPPPGPVTAVSIDGGTEPVWSPDGRELYYRHGEELLAVPVQTASGFSVGSSRTILNTPAPPTTGSNPAYDVFPGGDRFLILRPPPGAGIDRLRVVLNWTEELAEFVPITGR